MGASELDVLVEDSNDGIFLGGFVSMSCHDSTHSMYLVNDFASSDVPGDNDSLAGTDHALRLLRDDLDVHRLGREDIVVTYSAVEMEQLEYPNYATTVESPTHLELFQ